MWRTEIYHIAEATTRLLTEHERTRRLLNLARSEIKDVKGEILWNRRLMILCVLWAVGVLGNLGPQEIAQKIVDALEVYKLIR